MTTGITDTISTIDSSDDDAPESDTAAPTGVESTPVRTILRSPRGWPQRLSTLSRRATIATFAVLGILVGALGTATILLERSAADHRATAAAEQAAKNSAESRIPRVLSYDFNTMDREFASATDNLTGTFRADFDRLSSSVIVPAAHRDSIITRAKVVGTSVVTADPGKVTLLLFLDQETTSTKYQGPRLDGSRVRVVMTKVADQWLISDITPV
ncbi:hypothetical protein [Nocardia lijiangensis]|uniref:hypothetical protein n=1 Tax=Nocardia lijiangensis TaxID=299618 RepID=UPI003D74C5A5